MIKIKSFHRKQTGERFEGDTLFQSTYTKITYSEISHC